MVIYPQSAQQAQTFLTLMLPIRYQAGGTHNQFGIARGITRQKMNSANQFPQLQRQMPLHFETIPITLSPGR
jgi:hypothetical protein